MGVRVRTAYGLTETYGPMSTQIDHYDPDCTSNSTEADKSQQRLWQCKDVTFEELSVRDPVTLASVPADGTTIGEIMMRSNIVSRSATFYVFECKYGNLEVFRLILLFGCFSR